MHLSCVFRSRPLSGDIEGRGNSRPLPNPGLLAYFHPRLRSLDSAQILTHSHHLPKTHSRRSKLVSRSLITKPYHASHRGVFN